LQQHPRGFRGCTAQQCIRRHCRFGNVFKVDFIGRGPISLQAHLWLRGPPQTGAICSRTPREAGQPLLASKGGTSPDHPHGVGRRFEQYRRSHQYGGIRHAQLILRIELRPTRPHGKLAKLSLILDEGLKSSPGGRKGHLAGRFVQRRHDVGPFGFKGKEVS
jgi:hypothetical protein